MHFAKEHHVIEASTDRYQIYVAEKAVGGPGGYESTYLTSEGNPGEEELYSILSSFEGRLLPAEQGMIRQRNGPALVEALRESKNTGIASGFKPSGAYHFGHKLTSSAVSFFQRNGTRVFVPIADVECDMDSRISSEESKYWAADNLLDWGANGLNLDASHVYLQSEEQRVNALAYRVARMLTFERAIDIYGAEKLMLGFPFLFAGVTQVGDILLQQHAEFGNYHSFMVSGQDQDGHMKMTIALTEDSLTSGPLLGVKTVPSGFYIPHIRGLRGNKASSSKQEGTLYLGSGPNKEDLDIRIRSSLDKFDLARQEVSSEVELCCLDMVRFIDIFDERSKVDFGRITREAKKNEATLNDQDLIEICLQSGQNNVELVRDLLPKALTEHQRKREAVLNYALARATHQEEGGWGDNSLPQQPTFWKIPERAVVNESLRNTTKWYDVVAQMADLLVP